MKNLTRLSLLLAIILYGTFSCSKDKNETALSPLTGTWEYSKTTTNGSLLSRLTFNSDNTGSDYANETWGTLQETSTLRITWSINGTKLIISYENGNVLTYDYSISGNSLTLTDDEGSIEIYLRK